jgi:hypothetical protein
MPKYSFSFNTSADAEGKVEHKEDLSIPISVKLKRIHIQTQDNCRGRSHSTTVLVNGNTWVEGKDITDCEAFEFKKDVPVSSGPLSLIVISNGFEGDEKVSGHGWIEYSLSLLGRFTGDR